MINQIILSCNEAPIYFEFWPVIAKAYKKMFPDAKVHLAFVTHRAVNDSVVAGMFSDTPVGCNISLFKPVSHVPEFAQAKMARFILAAQQGNDVCYIDDIDLFPLSKKFITDKTDSRKKDHLLCVGGEVYDNNGCYPISQMTAEGYVWKQFINPNDLSYPELIESYIRDENYLDRREDMCLKLDWSKDDYFSDERLIRRLLHKNPVQKQEMERGYKDYLDATIDRHTYNKHTDTWEFDRDKLKNHGYVNAHGIRPYNKFKKHYEPLIEYINCNYK